MTKNICFSYLWFFHNLRHFAAKLLKYPKSGEFPKKKLQNTKSMAQISHICGIAVFGKSPYLCTMLHFAILVWLFIYGC